MTAKLAAGVLYPIASGKAGFELSAGFASNGDGEHPPGKYGFSAALVGEVVMTSPVPDRDPRRSHRRRGVARVLRFRALSCQRKANGLRPACSTAGRSGRSLPA